MTVNRPVDKTVTAEWLANAKDSCANNPNCTKTGMEWIDDTPYVVYLCDDGDGEVMRRYAVS